MERVAKHVHTVSLLANSIRMLNRDQILQMHMPVKAVLSLVVKHRFSSVRHQQIDQLWVTIQREVQILQFYLWNPVALLRKMKKIVSPEIPEKCRHNHPNEIKCQLLLSNSRGLLFPKPIVINVKLISIYFPGNYCFHHELEI